MNPDVLPSALEIAARIKEVVALNRLCEALRKVGLDLKPLVAPKVEKLEPEPSV